MDAIRIQVQSQDFDVAQEYQGLQQRSGEAGAIVFFVGLVRDFDASGKLDGLILEHYPGMTEQSLHGIVQKAMRRWSILGMTVIHRVGRLRNHEQIVLVAVSSHHRQDSFDAARFVMDYLKTEVPIWKKSVTANGEEAWVDAKSSDQASRERW